MIVGSGTIAARVSGEQSGLLRLRRGTLAGLALVASTVSAAQAQTITGPPSGPPVSTTFTVGFGPDGTLYDSGLAIGFRRNDPGPTPYDPIAPGVPRDSWGVSANGSSAFAASNSPSSGVVTALPVFGPSTAFFSTVTSVGLRVDQTFSFAAANILKVETTLTNIAGVALMNVLFQRDVDWDISPTEFNERSFAGPVSALANVADSSINGFESPDPLMAFFASCAFGCDETGDRGAGIRVSFGTIDADEFAKVTFYYGLSTINNDVSDLIGQATGAGAQYYVASESSEGEGDPGLNAAILGVSDIELSQAVPSPALAAGLPGFLACGLLLWRSNRRRRFEPVLPAV